jgi:exodeoxyribonuclease VII large subunit
MPENKVPLEINESLIFSVSEVTFHIKQVLETQIESLYIVGEISNFLRHGSGHIYLNLKDDNAVIRCAFFRSQNYQLDFAPQDGDQVVCFGKISLFEKSGQFQLIIQNMFPYGKGALLQRFEQLKLKLKTEGLFETSHKKPLPKYPDSIGVITSPTGAALQDILNILERRYPCHVYVYPSLMQGGEAAGQVVKGLEYFNSVSNVDLIIIARGGGSQEDLFCFNDEQLARAIFTSNLPVVSAIGHEIDFTIADFVADLRVPTPSAAAELVTPDREEVLDALESFPKLYNSAFKNKLANLHNNVHKSQIRLMQNNPERVCQSFQQRFDEAVVSLSHISDFVTNLKKEFLHQQKLFCRELTNLSQKLVLTGKHRQNLSAVKLEYALKMLFQIKNHRLELAEVTLDELSLQKTLSRGYSIIRKQGKIVNSVKQIKLQDDLEIVMADGSAQATVNSMKSDKPA